MIEQEENTMKNYVNPQLELVLLADELIRTSGLSLEDGANIEDMNGLDFSQW